MSKASVSDTPKLLSVVIPVYNEQESIEKCLEEVTLTLHLSNIDHELLVVNDGSNDRTLDICRSLKNKYIFRLINLNRNMGHMAAITAGLEASTGSYIATMDADLQDPPSNLIDMYKIITADGSSYSETSLEFIDVVQAFRDDRRTDSNFKRITASLYYSLIERILGFKIIHHAADFRIMTRQTVETLLGLPERNRIYRLLIPKLGFNVVPFPIVRQERYAGKTKYSLKRMIKLSIDSVLAFSYKPLRFFSYLGFLSSIVFLTASAVTLLISLNSPTVPGWPSMVLLLLGANSFLFAGLGLLGEYIGRIYELVQARPIANWTEIK